LTEESLVILISPAKCSTFCAVTSLADRTEYGRLMPTMW